MTYLRGAEVVPEISHVSPDPDFRSLLAQRVA